MIGMNELWVCEVISPNSTYVKHLIEEAEDFLLNLPNVCPFCGYIGTVASYHGYRDDWMCPIKVLSDHVELLKDKHLNEDKIEVRG